MIAVLSHRCTSPSTSTGTLPLGFSARNAGVRCSPRLRSTLTYSTGEPRYFATAHALRGFIVSA